MGVERVRRVSIAAAAWAAAAVAALTAATAAHGELRDDELQVSRVVRERDWLALRLQVLGLQLTYPAYRVELALTDSNAVRFVLWLGTPMAQHLKESGRDEAARVLGYHAEGIQSRVIQLMRSEFPGLWPRFDAATDFGGEFMVPGEALEAPPQRWARWRQDLLLWTEGS